MRMCSPHHEAHWHPWAPALRIERLDRCFEEAPVGLVRQPDQRVFWGDDVLQSGSEQVLGLRSLWLLRLHRPPPKACKGRQNLFAHCEESRMQNCKLFHFEAWLSGNFTSRLATDLPSPFNQLRRSSRTTSYERTPRTHRSSWPHRGRALNFESVHARAVGQVDTGAFRELGV